jgi:hypothetical protein
MLRLEEATLKWFNFMLEYDNDLSYKFRIMSLVYRICYGRVCNKEFTKVEINFLTLSSAILCTSSETPAEN